LVGYGPSMTVTRRYRDVEWLYNILSVRYPCCIIPPIPPKAALGNWYQDDSQYIVERK
jgi:hypothetical protein